MTIPRATRAVAAAAAAVVAHAPAQQTAVTWLDGPFAEALASATTRQQPVLVYFWMDGSAHCADLWGKTLTAAQAEAHLAAFVCHSANAATAGGRELIKRFGVSTLPTLLVVTPEGTVDDALLGFVPLPAFDREMQRIRSGNQTLSAMRAAAAAAPRDLDVRFALAAKLDFVGDRDAGERLRQSIRREDPNGRTNAGAELMLFDIRQSIIAAAADPNDLTTWNLQPMYDRLKKTKHRAVLFKGYGWLADTEGKRGDRFKQRAAWRAAWPHAPAISALEWGGEMLLGYWNQREDALSSKDRKLARSIANQLLVAVDGDDSPQAGAELRAFQLRCAACGLAVAGKLLGARKAIDRAVTLQPDDPDLLALAQQLHQ